MDFRDVADMALYWLGEVPFKDIAPPEGDGIINFQDLKVICDNWLENVWQ